MKYHMNVRDGTVVIFGCLTVMVLLFLRYRNFLNFMNKFVDNIVT